MDFSHLHTYSPPHCAPENTGYTYSLSSSYSTAALEFEREHQIAPVYESPKMSRRSMRLQGNASGLYGSDVQTDDSRNQISSRRESRTLLSRKQQLASGSLSLPSGQVGTPKKHITFLASSTPIDSRSRSRERQSRSDSYELTSAHHNSQMRKRIITTKRTSTTTTDGLWGESSSYHSNANGEHSVRQISSGNGYICRNCSTSSMKSSSCLGQSPSRTREFYDGDQTSSSTPITSVYTRDRSQRNKTGVLMSVCNTFIHCCKHAFAPVVGLVTLLFNSVVHLGSRPKVPAEEAGVLAAFWSSVKHMSSSSSSSFSSSLSKLLLFKQSILHRMTSSTDKCSKKQDPPSFCECMNVRDLMSEDDASYLNYNGSLCDDCKGRTYSRAARKKKSTKSSKSSRLLGALRSVLLCAGYYFLQPGHYVLKTKREFGSSFYAGVKTLLSIPLLFLSAPVRLAKGLLWFLARGWHQLVSFLSFLNVYFLKKCVPRILKILRFFWPFLLLLVLWLWGPSTSTLLAYLPRAKHQDTLVPPTRPSAPLEAVSDVDLKRLEQVEQQLALLWDRVKRGDEQQDQRHQDLFGLYNNLKEQLSTQTSKESLGVWVSSILEKRLSELRGELEQENSLRAQSAELQKQHQEAQAAHLIELEMLLKALAVKTDELQVKQKQYELWKEEKDKQATLQAAATPERVGVKQEDHDALLLEVQRLEGELSKIRQNLEAAVGCGGKCGQLDTLQQTISTEVSTQVRKELQNLFLSGEQQGEVPESLVAWLSEHYVTTPDLHAALVALEMSILRNISHQLELSQAHTIKEAECASKTVAQTITGTVEQAAHNTGLSEQQVKLIIEKALTLYSQDRTGKVDYALESGGGSVLSTRCSETYETKTALMSLFGLPLWYFSQSPRVVIQPDVYPGNCWAFKGSQGYLVIRLSLRILPSSFAVEHIPKSLSPTGSITSAPRSFSVYGLDNEYQEEGKLLGNYMYDADGESLQIFPVTEENDMTFQIIELRVHSNWGHPEYTCLYRFRVHGEPRSH